LAPTYPCRKTTQGLATDQVTEEKLGQYNPCPGFPIGPGKIRVGFQDLAEELKMYSQVTIDGYGGVLWENLRSRLDRCFHEAGLNVNWVNVSSALRSTYEIDQLVSPFLGGDDPLFGYRFPGSLDKFFAPDLMKQLNPDTKADLNIVYGCGAALAKWQGLLVYIDVPKNEIQLRAREGRISNLGMDRATSFKSMYKRFYFIDWNVLNRHKAELLPRLDWIVDEQRQDEPLFIKGDDLRAAFHQMSTNYFRPRPWFEPGPWGGSWIKNHIQQISQEVPNYAWSFELISPENGLALQSGPYLLEISFDFLMYQESELVLGKCAQRFGYEFPIRFDFLDTFEGGNLSIQCHPSNKYIKEQFGEKFTQDEAYYILDCLPGAKVYLGFQDDIKPERFRDELEWSVSEKKAIDIDRFVWSVASHKHDFYLIPNGTIHGAGKDNLVLEISATPYIFTFKMYDWLRLDLDGQPRTLNIGRAFENLNFSRKGQLIDNELVSTPQLLRQGRDWRVERLPTHPKHFYEVLRITFQSTIEVQTDGQCHVLSLVEGKTVLLQTEMGLKQRFNYAETFIVPAAAEQYLLTNETNESAKILVVHVKEEVNVKTTLLANPI
jgi:mannose-6-phosphate isomerase class I